MANRRRQSKNTSKGFYRQSELANISPASQTLTDRAVKTGLVYNYLEYVSPADVDGIKRAYVNVKDGHIDARPISADKAMVAVQTSPYGQKPTIVPEYNKPTALITQYSPQDKLFPQLEKYGNSLLRSALRKIVDEV
jgi:hypothetical protein